MPAPSSTLRSMARIVFCSAQARTAGSLAVTAPPLKAGSANRFVVAMGTASPVSSSACLNSRTPRLAKQVAPDVADGPQAKGESVFRLGGVLIDHEGVCLLFS